RAGTGPDAPAGYGRMLRLPKEEAPHSRGAPRSDSSYLVTGPERAVPARDAYTSSGEQCLRDHARQRRCDLARALFARLPRHYTVPLALPAGGVDQRKRGRGAPGLGTGDEADRGGYERPPRIEQPR